MSGGSVSASVRLPVTVVVAEASQYVVVSPTYGQGDDPSAIQLYHTTQYVVLPRLRREKTENLYGSWSSCDAHTTPYCTALHCRTVAKTNFNRISTCG